MSSIKEWTPPAANTNAAQPPSPQDGKSYIGGLDGLRAISVITVIFGHVGIEKIPASLGVTIFFFISGFLITGLLLKEGAKSNGHPNIRNFYARRYLRLMPELALYVLVALVGSFFLTEKPRMIDVFGSIFYFTNYLNVFNPTDSLTVFRFGHFWSLAVEEHFYLTWPLLVYACRGRLRFLLATTVALILFPVGLRAVDLALGLPVEYVRFASECRIDSIAYGSLLAILMHFKLDELQRLFRRGEWALLLGGALVLAFTYGKLIGLRGNAHEVLVYCGQGVGLFLVFGYLYISTSSKWLIDFLDTPPLQFVGRVSYGVYIWHFMFIYVFTVLAGFHHQNEMPIIYKLATACFATTASIFAGWASWKFALQPVNSWRKKFGAHI